MKKQIPISNESQLRLQLSTEENAKHDQLQKKYLALEAENEQLKARLAHFESNIAMVSESAAPYQHSLIAKPSTVATAAEKIALFQNLFRGRTDIFAERRQKKDGTHSYSPVKIHFWDSHIQTKQKRWLCGAECKAVPLTEKILEEHLKGIRTIGVYPLLLDETCWFLAFDFDKLDWREDVLAFDWRQVFFPAYCLS